MKFKLDKNNKILMYGGDIFDYSIDIEISDIDLELLNNKFTSNECFLKNTNVIIGSTIKTSLLDEEIKNNLRAQRIEILKAFDIYKTNVLYGLINESEEEHLIIFDWYNKMLELEESAFAKIPEKIKYYMN
jgi:hypothetical protein